MRRAAISSPCFAGEEFPDAGHRTQREDSVAKERPKLKRHVAPQNSRKHFGIEPVILATAESAAEGEVAAPRDGLSHHDFDLRSRCNA